MPHFLNCSSESLSPIMPSNNATFASFVNRLLHQVDLITLCIPVGKDTSQQQQIVIFYFTPNHPNVKPQAPQTQTQILIWSSVDHYNLEHHPHFVFASTTVLAKASFSCFIDKVRFSFPRSGRVPHNLEGQKGHLERSRWERDLFLKFGPRDAVYFSVLAPKDPIGKATRL